MKTQLEQGEGTLDMNLAKRQRLAPHDNDHDASIAACFSGRDPHDCRDYFQEIFDSVSPTEIYNSWLCEDRPIYSSEDPADDTMDLSMQDLSDSMSEATMSLSQQLLQVKRKLWPAAEKCALAYNKTRDNAEQHLSSTSPQSEFAQARRWCNPMEPLGEGRARGLNHNLFMNRSAIKLANIDAMLEFRLTQQQPDSSPFLFVDLCGAPGGFSEYLMMRSRDTHHWATNGTIPGSCRGYGMSLLGMNEHGKGTHWRLNPHISEWNTQGNYHTEYKICRGVDGTGDIYQWENVEFLANEIRSDLQSCGKLHVEAKVNLVVADGGFDAQRDSECQEGMAQKLVLSEMAAGISLLQLGGKFVIKMFGFQSSSIRAALCSMSDMFESMQVLKPISSRPASSERYVVFEGFRGLPTKFDHGASWLGQILLGRAALGPLEKYTMLNTYLDQMELDMLALNLRACFAILSTLDRKTTAITSGSVALEDWDEERMPINVASYKWAWRLE